MVQQPLHYLKIPTKNKSSQRIIQISHYDLDQVNEENEASKMSVNSANRSRREMSDRSSRRKSPSKHKKTTISMSLQSEEDEKPKAKTKTKKAYLKKRLNAIQSENRELRLLILEMIEL
mmetsp:Transcript_31020/g.47419  ORF Transcript_31020/g.47419 Transcript_31020/m.47419 type:complete len:119 (+) Transcript_31020:2027-2383(+)